MQQTHYSVAALLCCYAALMLIRVSVAFTEGVYDRLRVRAAGERLSMSQMAALLVEAGLEGGEPSGAVKPRRSGGDRTPPGASPPSSPVEGAVSRLFEGRK